MRAASPRTIEGLLAERAWLRRLARRLVRDEAAADDLTQDALVAALERAPASVRSPRAWLATVLRNLARNRARAEGRRRAHERARAVPAGAPGTVETLARAEVVERLGRAVLGLPEAYRDVVLLRYFDGEPPRRVARRLGLPVETVRTRLKRATAMLAREMDETPGGRPAWAGALLAWSRMGGAALLAAAIGGIAMKKTLVAAVAVLLVAAGAAIRWWPEGSPRDAGPPEGTVAGVPDADGAATPTALHGLPGPERDDVRSLAGTGRLRGAVVDESGRPVAGVRVWVGPPPERGWIRFYDPPPLESDPPAPPPLGEATSGPDGRFEVTGIAYGRRVGVEARPEPPRRGSYAVAEVHPWSEPRVLLVVGDGAPLRGRVVDASGRGVLAWVEGHQPLGTGAAVNAGRWFAGPDRTDAEGRFAWPAVPDGYVQVTAVVPGGAARRGFLVATPAKGEVLVPLHDSGGGVVAGTVRGTAGDPIAGAAVVVESQEITAWIPDTTVGRTVTGPDGRYSVAGLVPGRVFSVVATAPGYGPPAAWYGYDTQLRAGETTEFDVTLARGVVVQGRVVDAEGAALRGARVTAMPQFTPFQAAGKYLPMRWEADSDGEGRFRIEGLPFLPVHLLASMDGLAADPGDPVRPSAEGETIGATLTMRPVATFSVAGVAADEGGRAVPGTLVTALAPVTEARAGTPELVRAVECAADGSFRLAGLETNRTWRLMANAPGYASDATAARDAAPLRLVLRPQGAVRGRVVGPDGRGVPDLDVRLTTPTGILREKSALDGGFDFQGLAAGTHVVRAFDRLGSAGDGVPVAVVAGATADAEIRVSLHALRGVVVDGAGRPVRTRHVSLGGTPGASTQTDLDGRFEFLLFVSGEFSLTVGHETMPGTYATGPHEHRIVSNPQHRRQVEVELVAPDGRALEGGMVWFRAGSGGSGARVGGGRFRGELDETAERFDLEVAWGTDAAGRRVNVKPAVFRDLDPARSPLSLALEPGRAVEGRVVDPSGRGLPGVEVLVGRTSDLDLYGRMPDHRGAHAWTTDAEGRFTAIGLPAEKVVVAARPPKGWVEPRDVALGDGQDEVTVVLERGTRLAGVVRDTEGRPVAGSTIHVSESADRRWGATTDAEGRFAVEGLPPAARVGVTAAGPAPLLSATLGDVRAGRDDLELRLPSGAYVEGEVVGEGWTAEDDLRVDARRPGEASRGWTAASVSLPEGTARFRVGPLEPGEWRIAVRASGLDDLATVDVVAPATGVRLPIPRARHVFGRIVGDDPAKFRIAVRIGERTTWTSVDAHGWFRIRNVEEGPVGVYAWRDGDPRMALVEVAAPSGALALRLEPGLEIAGRVEGLPSDLKVPVQVTVRTPWVERKAEGGTDGSFRVTGLPPGRYEVEVWSPVGGVDLRATDVPAGTTDLRLP